VDFEDRKKLLAIALTGIETFALIKVISNWFCCKRFFPLLRPAPAYRWLTSEPGLSIKGGLQ
jgi:hypothetical protein